MITVAEFQEWMAEPRGFHPESGAGRGVGLVIASESETFYVRWCCRNKCGGVYRVTRNQWELIVPIEFRDFLEKLDRDGVLPFAAHDFQALRWIKMCRLAASSLEEADL